ncbi:hypothetical protein HDU93_001567 [Gonapodya sp. JEL0774]|nr:hypothetical protein HDU93_001567 [Gonapodya sp. JEL0774]
MAAAFTLPTPLSHLLSTHFSLAPATSLTLAQLVLPCSIQLVSTPVHLAALDYYNHPSSPSPSSSSSPSASASGSGSGTTIRDRTSRVAREYGKSVLARMGRVLPAYGIGGVMNGWVREQGRDLVGRGWDGWCGWREAGRRMVPVTV